MSRFAVIIILLCVFLPMFNYAQTDKIITPAKSKTIPHKSSKQNEKEFSKISVKAGVNISVIYLARNIKEKNNEPGYCAGLLYDINGFVRLSGLYTRFQPINIEPTWYNVRANTFELNMELIAKFPNKKTLLYPFIGLSYNTYKGFFTGQQDYLNLLEYYKANSTIVNRWLGVNVGIGMEHNFGTLGLFVDYRMRVGKQEKAFNIMDVCYTGGLKVRFPYGKVAKSIAHPNDRFHWF